MTEEEFNETVRARLKSVRAQLGFNQFEMALLLDMDETRYAKYENRAPMPLYQLVRFAAIFALDLRELVTFDRRARPVIYQELARGLRLKLADIKAGHATARDELDEPDDYAEAAQYRRDAVHDSDRRFAAMLDKMPRGKVVGS